MRYFSKTGELKIEILRGLLREAVNPVRNSSEALNPAGIILKSNPAAEQRGIISNGVKGVVKMKASVKKVSDVTVDELKSVIHEVVTEDMEAWGEPFEIIADKKLMKQIKQADMDWASDKKDSHLAWDNLKNV